MKEHNMDVLVFWSIWVNEFLLTSITKNIKRWMRVKNKNYNNSDVLTANFHPNHRIWWLFVALSEWGCPWSSTHFDLCLFNDLGRFFLYIPSSLFLAGVLFVSFSFFQLINCPTIFLFVSSSIVFGWLILNI